MTDGIEDGMDAYGVLDAVTAYQRSAVIATAVRVDVFGAIGDAAMTASAVAGACGTAEAPTRTLLDALADMSLLVRDGSEHVPTYRGRGVASHLARGGALSDLVAKEDYLAGQWQRLDETVRTGTPTIPSWRRRLQHDPASSRTFLRALVTLARMIGADLTGIAELGAGRAVVDAGGGLGSYAVPLADGGAHVRLVELPQVAAWCREELAGRADIEVVAADLLAAPALGVAPGSADTVLMSHLLHDLDDADARTVLARARDALRPGGAVVVLEIPGDAPAPLGAMFDLMMQIETPGRARRSLDLVELLRGAGFDRVRDGGVAAPNLVLVGERG